MKPETKTNLHRLINLVDALLIGLDEKLGARPAWESSTLEERDDYWRAEHGALNELRDRLAETEGARFYHQPPDGHAIRMGGIRSSSTSGWRGALTNWQKAARRRIQKEFAS
ncbi:hypothetical protein [Nitratireductor rhodophyticola]|uniref:hypothetical protein n=1 Tax=Nitratireductor rhodophyticola TaxID=2854036 RepID=UPI003008AD69